MRRTTSQLLVADSAEHVSSSGVRPTIAPAVCADSDGYDQGSTVQIITCQVALSTTEPSSTAVGPRLPSRSDASNLACPYPQYPQSTLPTSLVGASPWRPPQPSPRSHSAPPRPFLQNDDLLTNRQLLTLLSGEPALCRADSPDPFRDCPPLLLPPHDPTHWTPRVHPYPSAFFPRKHRTAAVSWTVTLTRMA